MEIDLSKAVSSFVEAMLPRGSAEDVVLYVPCRCSYWNYHEGVNDRKEVNKDLHFLFHRPGNYTKVLFLSEDYVNGCDCHFSYNLRPNYKELFKDKWDLIANHDSCWRDGLERKIREEEEKLIAEVGLERPLPPNSYYVSFGFSDPCLCHAEVVRTRRALEDSINFNGVENYTVNILGRVKTQSVAEFIAETCATEDLPLLINHEDEEVRMIVAKRLRTIEKTRPGFFVARAAT
jgi:hypothetical protein